MMINSETSDDDLVRCPACDGMGERRGPQIGLPWYECKYCEGTVVS